MLGTSAAKCERKLMSASRRFRLDRWLHGTYKSKAAQCTASLVEHEAQRQMCQIVIVSNRRSGSGGLGNHGSWPVGAH